MREEKKYNFRITFCYRLEIRVSLEVEFLAFNVLLCIKSELKYIGNLFCAPIIIKNLLKTGFSIRNILLQFVSGVFGLLKDISYSKNILIDY